MTGTACIASASAFVAPACVGPASRTVARSGVTELSMNAGTGKIKSVASFRAGVPRTSGLAGLTAADKKALANYDSAAALGIKSQVAS